MRHVCLVAIGLAVIVGFGAPCSAGQDPGAKVLNNFVAELLAVGAPQQESEKTYAFTNPRDGWIFISSTAAVQGADKVSVSLDSPATEDAVIVHTQDAKETLEAMRDIPAGPHKLTVRCEGAARPAALVVRAIPSIIPVEVGYHRAPLVQPAYGPYTWEFLEGIDLLQNGNVVIERTPAPGNARHLAEWRRQGKKVLKYRNRTWEPRPLTTEAVVAGWLGEGSQPFQLSDYDGVIVDEFPVSAQEYPIYTEAVKRIATNAKFAGKVVYAYCGRPQYWDEDSLAFANAIMDAGYHLAEERYLPEQPTESAAKAFLDEHLKQPMRLYRESFPNFDARFMSMTLGFMSGAPESSDLDPAVDYKVYLDMQMNLLANDPAFAGLHGIEWYHIGYVDEEILRWGVKLLRHYGIEGKRERLTDDPYRLRHVANGDFEEGFTGWTVAAAEEGSVSIGQAAGYGFLQGRYGNRDAGNTLLVTRRSDKAPNRIRQTIKGLTPGRTYSVTMYVVDYADCRNGKSVVAEAPPDSSAPGRTLPLALHSETKEIEQPHYASVQLEEVDLAANGSFHVVFGSGMCGHGHGPFDRKNQLYITYRRDVFRAKGPTAELTISDWASDDAAGGPVGQELGFNFIQVQPYLED